MDGGLPLGIIDKEVGKLLEGEIGKFMDVDVGENVAEAGCFLRGGGSNDIKKPLMRRLDEGKGIESWCPLCYEFVCYVCGLIGHVDKVCKKVEGSYVCSLTDLSEYFQREGRELHNWVAVIVEVGDILHGTPLQEGDDLASWISIMGVWH